MARFFLTKRDIISQVFSFLLGLAISASPIYTLVLISTTAMIYLMVTFGRPYLHPGDILGNARNQIAKICLWLDDEAATRHSVDMYAISVRGYHSLGSAEERVETLLTQHRMGYTIRNAFQYATALPKLVSEARKCQSDIQKLESDLEQEVSRLS